MQKGEEGAQKNVSNSIFLHFFVLHLLLLQFISLIYNTTIITPYPHDPYQLPEANMRPITMPFTEQQYWQEFLQQDLSAAFVEQQWQHVSPLPQSWPF